MKNYRIEELGNVPAFQTNLLQEGEQEQRAKKSREWTKLLEMYIRQREIISKNPFPESDEYTNEDELPPSIKLLERNVSRKYEGRLYRWGIGEFSIGNFRIIYIIYDYYKVLLLDAFDKQYNGDIKRDDIG